ncbi:MAG: hypothetical protein WKF30_16570 [Pyrinomonadaceae bacterium]
MNKHRPRTIFRHEYIKGRHSGLTDEEREWRIWEEMDKEEAGYEELVERLHNCRSERDRSGDTEQST